MQPFTKHDIITTYGSMAEAASVIGKTRQAIYRTINKTDEIDHNMTLLILGHAVLNKYTDKLPWRFQATIMCNDLSKYDEDIQWCRNTFVYGEKGKDAFEEDVAYYIAYRKYKGDTEDQAHEACMKFFADDTHRLIEDFVSEK